MFRKWIILISVIMVLFTFPNEGSAANNLLKSLQKEDIHILFIYTTKQNIKTDNVKKLDLLLHHFTDDVELVSEYDVKLDDVTSATHIVYYGGFEHPLQKDLIDILRSSGRQVIAVGENIEQFSSIKLSNNIYINGMNDIANERNMTIFESRIEVKNMMNSNNVQTVLYGYRSDTFSPLLVQHKNLYYFGVTQMDSDPMFYFAESLHDILPNNHQSDHLAYIRLEDIHPMTDPEKLLEVGEYLNERNIPFMLVVIPVYINPETGKSVYYKNSPELVKVLQYLQDTGGTVVAHGYTHQYRSHETGEGFEFWDVDHDQFIISSIPGEVVTDISSSNHFPKSQDYQSYLEPLLEKEKAYIEGKLQNSIAELTYYDLYPLAFEAPHYTMSSQGYRITSGYFSTIVGQVQYSDDSWTNMGPSPYITSANFLNGMGYLPETLGYVDPELEKPFKEMKEEIGRSLLVRDSVIGGFYHPFLGVEYLEEFLEQFDSIPDITWLDLKQTSQHVSTPKIRISSDGAGAITVTRNVKWWEDWVRQNELTSFEYGLWGITLIVFGFVLLFLIFSLYLRTQLKKRLFKERKNVG